MKSSGSKPKFLTCFRPVGGHMEEMLLDDAQFSKSSTVIAIDLSKSHASLIPADKNSSKGILDRSVSDCSAFAGAGRCPEKSDSGFSRRKSFSRAIKSILSELSLSPRPNDRKQRNRGSDFASRVSSLTRTISTDAEEYKSIRKEFDETKSSSSSSSSSGSDAENPSTPAGKARRTQKPQSESGPVRSGGMSLIVLLLVSLAVTVLGGKLLGVALTSMCLYLMPCRRKIAGESGKGESGKSLPAKGRSSETEYKKQRVVMEGMLKRSYRHHNLQSIK